MKQNLETDSSTQEFTTGRGDIQMKELSINKVDLMDKSLGEKLT